MDKDLVVSDLFVFLTDLIAYTTKELGLKWEWSFGTPDCRRFFTSEQGDSTLRYRNSWDDQFRLRIRQHKLKDILDPIAIQIYVEFYASECFKVQTAETIPEQFFQFSAFLVDLAIFCFRYGRQDLINTALFCTSTVYDCYLRGVSNNEFWYGMTNVAIANNHLAGRTSCKELEHV